MPHQAGIEYRDISPIQDNRDHDYDLLHELSKKLNALWHYDQYIANAEGSPIVQAFWRDFKCQCQTDIQQLKQLIAHEIRKGCE